MKWRNVIACVVILSMIPLTLFADLLSIIVEKIADYVNFMNLWMELWTGIRKQ